MATAFIDRTFYEDRSAPLAPPANEFTCADCECVEMSLLPTLPAGWTLVERAGAQAAICTDCSRLTGRREAAAAGSDALRAADALSEAADHLTRLCRERNPDEAAIDAAGTFYMVALADFSAVLETRTGVDVARIVQLLTGKADNLIEPTLADNVLVWPVPAAEGRAHG